MNCSFACEKALPENPVAAIAATANAKVVRFMDCLLLAKFVRNLFPPREQEYSRSHSTDNSRLGSVRERPKPQFFLGDLPSPRQPVRLDDQEEHDQAAEDDQLDVRLHRVGDLDPEPLREPAEQQAEEDR